MTDSPTKKAATLLQPGAQPDWGFLLGKVRKLSEINQLITPILGPTIAPYCQVGNLTGSRLTLLAANGSVATQVRFQTQDLLRKFKLHANLKHIQQIECKVSPTPLTPQLPQRDAPPKVVQRLSIKTAQFLRDMADGMEDGKLKTIMQKIAGYTK